MKKLFLILSLVSVLGVSQARAQFGRDYWRLQADTLKIINPNWYIAAQNFIPIIGGTTNLFLGYQSGFGITSGTYNLGLGYQSLYNAGRSTSQTALGYRSLYSDTGGTQSVAIGPASLFEIQNSTGNTVVGNSGFQNLGHTNNASNYNTGLGSGVGASIYYGQNNLFAGYGAGYGNLTATYDTANYVVALGNSALNNIINTSYAVALGPYAGFSSTHGNNSLYLGAFSGYANILGANNLFLGDSAGFRETGSNKLYISNSSTSSPLVYGDFAGDSLRVNGQLSSSGNIVGYGNATLSGNLSVNGTGTSSFAGNLGLGTVSVGSYMRFPNTISYPDTNVSGIWSQPLALIIQGGNTSGTSITLVNNLGASILDANQDLSVKMYGNATLAGNLTVNGTGTNTFAGTLTQSTPQGTKFATDTTGIIQSGGYLVTPSSQAFTNTTTLANITGLSVVLQAGHTYGFEANTMETVATSAGEKFAVTYSGTSSYAIYDVVATTSAIAQSTSNWTTTLGTAIANTSSNVNASANIRGTIVTTGSGTLNIQYAQNTAQATGNTIQRGSAIRVWQIN
ncbi:MAG: hypothetical protein KGJ90_02415 [Patescibacteria group bacterium]|nr:hypothetical protein [Patescibacteria group bacterium]